MNRHFIVDEQAQKLTFTDQRFYPHPNGNWYPSVSSILNCYPKSEQFYQWLKDNGDQADIIRDEASDNGSIVHSLTELYDNGQQVSCLTTSGSVAYSSKAWSMFERYVEFSERFTPEILEIEKHMVSPELGMGGTLDRKLRLDDKTLIVDIKTSGAIHNHFWLQMAAYAKMYEKLYNEKIDGIAILWLNAKTRTEGKKGQIQGRGWQMCFPDKDIEYYWKLFRCVHALFLEENGDLKPRHLSYKLSHKKVITN